MSCTICQHPKRQAIDQALIAGSATRAALSQEYGLSTSALHRHKAHLQANVNRAKDQLQNNLYQSCFFWLSQALEMVMQTAQAAQAEGNFKVVLQAIRQGTRLITIILKQDFQLGPEVVYEILASPQWTTQASLLPDDPTIMSRSRQSLAGTLSSPCPEIAAVPPSPVSPEDLDLVKENLLVPAQPAAQPKTENCLSKQREKGGKLPGKTPFKKDNNQKNQEDKLYEKITGIMDLPFQARQVPLETRNSKFATVFQGLENSGKIPADMPLSEYIYEQSLKDNQPRK